MAVDVDVDVDVLGRITTQGKAAVRLSGLIMLQIYKVFPIKTILSVAVTNEIKQQYQQEWIFGSLSIFYSPPTFLIQTTNYELS